MKRVAPVQNFFQQSSRNMMRRLRNLSHTIDIWNAVAGLYVEFV